MGSITPVEWRLPRLGNKDGSIVVGPDEEEEVSDGLVLLVDSAWVKDGG